MTRSWTGIWPVIIILSTIAAGIAVFLLTSIPIRPLIVIWFLFLCPGMTVIRFFHLREIVIELAQAIALSITIDAFIASIQLYMHLWSPEASCGILIALCLIGSTFQLTEEYLMSNETAPPH
ncbi:MAG TPA: hypothetical protein VH593_06655 [Ktedonobacteraceae bacterium]